MHTSVAEPPSTVMVAHRDENNHQIVFYGFNGVIRSHSAASDFDGADVATPLHLWEIACIELHSS
jgi:hypothetical protein